MRWLGWIGGAVACLCALAVAGLFVLDWFAGRSAQDLSQLPQRTVRAPGGQLYVAVATSTQAVGHGLSGQESLPPNYGLLLIPPDHDTRVTMLGMKFPLDVIWLDAGGRIVHVVASAPARPWPLSYSYEGAAARVLEIGAGQAERLGLREGVRIDELAR